MKNIFFLTRKQIEENWMATESKPLSSLAAEMQNIVP